MRNRIKLRANSIKKRFDKVSEDGTLIRGAIYLNELLPVNKKRISSLNEKKRKDILKKLTELNTILKKEFRINEIIVDKQKLRLLTSEKTIRKLAEQITPKLFKLAIVEEYPTYDEFEVEIDFI